MLEHVNLFLIIKSNKKQIIYKLNKSHLLQASKYQVSFDGLTTIKYLALWVFLYVLRS